MCRFYTGNQLTLAQGFTPPDDRPASLNVTPLSGVPSMFDSSNVKVLLTT